MCAIHTGTFCISKQFPDISVVYRSVPDMGRVLELSERVPKSCILLLPAYVLLRKKARCPRSLLLGVR